MVSKQNLSTLTKESVLKDSVLYSLEFYDQVKRLIIEQLRAEHTRILVTELLLNFIKSDAAIILANEQLSDVLRINPVVDSFVKGVVNDNIYKMMTDKELARKLDNHIYEVLK